MLWDLGLVPALNKCVFKLAGSSELIHLDLEEFESNDLEISPSKKGQFIHSLACKIKRLWVRQVFKACPKNNIICHFSILGLLDLTCRAWWYGMSTGYSAEKEVMVCWCVQLNHRKCYLEQLGTAQPSALILNLSCDCPDSRSQCFLPCRLFHSQECAQELLVSQVCRVLPLHSIRSFSGHQLLPKARYHRSMA